MAARGANVATQGSSGNGKPAGRKLQGLGANSGANVAVVATTYYRMQGFLGGVAYAWTVAGAPDPTGAFAPVGGLLGIHISQQWSG